MCSEAREAGEILSRSVPSVETFPPPDARPGG